jgi:hypothetical protein
MFSSYRCAFCFSTGQRYIYTGSSDKSVHIYDVVCCFHLLLELLFLYCNSVVDSLLKSEV